MNLIEFLGVFNSKERFFLVGEALGNRAFKLAPEFRDRLKEAAKLERPIPSDAFSAMDYHIDWLYASLAMAFGRESAKLHENNYRGQHIIHGQQEDIDWLIAYPQGNKYHIILIEAKGVTNWNGTQMNSKARRFKRIFGYEGTNWQEVEPHFVLISPKEPRKESIIGHEEWPSWMMPQGSLHYLRLVIPSGLRRIVRVDKHGNESRRGGYWKTALRKPEDEEL